MHAYYSNNIGFVELKLAKLKGIKQSSNYLDEGTWVRLGTEEIDIS
jgi:hypothetical protein